MSRNDLVGAQWRKSSYSDGQANCVEVAAAGLVAVRDSNSFAEPSWVSIFFGNRVWPRRHDPLADLIDEKQLRSVLDQRAAAVQAGARALPDHMAFISAHCRADAA